MKKVQEGSVKISIPDFQPFRPFHVHGIIKAITSFKVGILCNIESLDTNIPIACRRVRKRNFDCHSTSYIKDISQILLYSVKKSVNIKMNTASSMPQDLLFLELLYGITEPVTEIAHFLQIAS